MEPHYLSTRENWQQEAGTVGASLRDAVATILRNYLERIDPGTYEVTIEPKDLAQIYYEYEWIINCELYTKPESPTADDVWYDSDSDEFKMLRGQKIVPATGGGCIPDLKIQHLPSGRAYFIECKQQNDAGNAHERCAKFATSSILERIQMKAGKALYHPIGYIFSGALVEKRKYQLELKATYGFARDHLLLWKKERNPKDLEEWFGNTIVPLLRGDSLKAVQHTE